MQIHVWIFLLLIGKNLYAEVEFLQGKIQVEDTKPYRQYLTSAGTGERVYLHGLYGQESIDQKVAIPLKNIFFTNRGDKYIVNPSLLPIEALDALDLSVDTVEFYFAERVQPKDEAQDDIGFSWGHSATRIGDRVYNFFPFQEKTNYYKHVLSPIDFFFGENGYLFARNIWSIKIKIGAEMTTKLQIHLDETYGKNGENIAAYDKIANNCTQPLNESLKFLGIKDGNGRDYRFVEPFAALDKLGGSFSFKSRLEDKNFIGLGVHFYPQIKIVESMKESIYGRSKSFFHFSKSDVDVLHKDLTSEWASLSLDYIEVSFQNLNHSQENNGKLSVLTCDGLIEEGDITVSSFLSDFFNSDRFREQRKLLKDITNQQNQFDKISDELRTLLSKKIGIEVEKIGNEFPLIQYSSKEDLVKIAENAEWSFLKDLVRKPKARNIEALESMCRAGKLPEELRPKFNSECSFVEGQSYLNKLQLFIDIVFNKSTRSCKYSN